MISFVTGNKGKFAEVCHLLTGYDLRQEHLEYPEIQADSLEKVALFALHWLQNDLKGPFFLEDAGLFVEALQGFPGVYSAYVYRTIGNRGLLRLLDGAAHRRAYFRSVIAFYDGKHHLFEGICPGCIAASPLGDRGFGYDPIFVPAGSSTTFAEMGTAEKNTYSHRGIAVRRLLAYLQGQPRP